MKIIECPRDAMQGLHEYIPARKKVAYIEQLLKVGFDTIDFGSFVSPGAVPQMRDTAEVIKQLSLQDERITKLLAIVANIRGADEALAYDQIDYLGFPFSISETFQKRNTNSSITRALETLDVIQEKCLIKNKMLVTYISMGFGNPYNDPYDVEIVLHYAEELVKKGINIISLADTTGVSSPEQITYLFSQLAKQFPVVEFGAHLHAHPAGAVDKIAAAYNAGCRRFDGAIKGYGGCPMAKDELVGNMATETIVAYLEEQNDALSINREEFEKAIQMATKIFPETV